MNFLSIIKAGKSNSDLLELIEIPIKNYIIYEYSCKYKSVLSRIDILIILKLIDLQYLILLFLLITV